MHDNCSFSLIESPFYHSIDGLRQRHGHGIHFFVLDVVFIKNCHRYESSPPSTLLFFAVQELLIFSISSAIAYLVLSGTCARCIHKKNIECSERMTGMQSVYCFVVIVSIGTIV